MTLGWSADARFSPRRRLTPCLRARAGLLRLLSRLLACLLACCLLAGSLARWLTRLSACSLKEPW